MEISTYFHEILRKNVFIRELKIVERLMNHVVSVLCLIHYIFAHTMLPNSTMLFVNSFLMLFLKQYKILIKYVHFL